MISTTLKTESHPPRALYDANDPAHSRAHPPPHTPRVCILTLAVEVRSSTYVRTYSYVIIILLLLLLLSGGGGGGLASGGGGSGGSDVRTDIRTYIRTDRLLKPPPPKNVRTYVRM